MSKNKPVLVDDSKGLVLQEAQVTVSDEKLRAILSETYERARRDGSSCRWFDYHQTALSIFFTLLITLVTSEFQDIHKGHSNDILISAITLQWTFIVVDILMLFIGLIMLCARANRKSSDANEERDCAISDMLCKHCKSADEARTIE